MAEQEPDGVQALQQFTEATTLLQSLNAEVIRESERRLRALKVLLDEGWSLRRIASGSGLTHGRIQQLSSTLHSPVVFRSLFEEEA